VRSVLKCLQARNQLGTLGGAKSLLRGPKIFNLCPIVTFNYRVHYLFVELCTNITRQPIELESCSNHQTIWDHAKDFYPCLDKLDKRCHRAHRGKLWLILSEYCVDRHKSLVIEPLIPSFVRFWNFFASNKCFSNFLDYFFRSRSSCRSFSLTQTIFFLNFLCHSQIFTVADAFSWNCV